MLDCVRSAPLCIFVTFFWGCAVLLGTFSGWDKDLWMIMNAQWTITITVDWLIRPDTTCGSRWCVLLLHHQARLMTTSRCCSCCYCSGFSKTAGAQVVTASQDHTARVAWKKDSEQLWVVEKAQRLRWWGVDDWWHLHPYLGQAFGCCGECLLLTRWLTDHHSRMHSGCQWPGPAFSSISINLFGDCFFP